MPGTIIFFFWFFLLEQTVFVVVLCVCCIQCVWHMFSYIFCTIVHLNSKHWAQQYMFSKNSIFKKNHMKNVTTLPTVFSAWVLQTLYREKKKTFRPGVYKKNFFFFAFCKVLFFFQTALIYWKDLSLHHLTHTHSLSSAHLWYIELKRNDKKEHQNNQF